MKHPSVAGLQVAKIYSRLLERLLPKSVKAVLVVGSNAIGMALPTSDVDMVVVKDCPRGEHARLLGRDDPIIIAFKRLGEKVGSRARHMPQVISTREFLKLENLDYTPAFRFAHWSAAQIRAAAVPVFVQKGFEAQCKRVLAAQPHSKNLPALLARYKEKGNFKERLNLRAKWRKPRKPQIIR